MSVSKASQLGVALLEGVALVDEFGGQHVVGHGGLL